VVHFSEETPCLKILSLQTPIIDPSIRVDWASTRYCPFVHNKTNKSEISSEKRTPKPMEPELYQSTKLSYENIIKRVETMKNMKLKLMKELIGLKTEAKTLGDSITDELRIKIKNCESSKKVCEDQIAKLDAEKIELQKVIEREEQILKEIHENQQ
jgi:hypothetical protein